MTANRNGVPPGGEIPENLCRRSVAQFDRPDNSRGSALLQEFVAANAQLHDGCVDWVMRQGVPESAIWKTGNAVVGVGRIEMAGPYFEFNPDGYTAIILAVTWLSEPTTYEDPLDTLGDLVAWRSADPSKWSLRRCVATILAPEAIERAVHFDQPLCMWESPLAWLQKGMVGSVILDNRTDLQFWLGNVKRIHCQTKRLAIRIERALNAVPKRNTEILYAKSSHAA